MKTKRGLFFVAMMAVILAAALLVTNCLEPINLDGLSGGRTTAVKFTFGDDSFRTIMPSIPAVTGLTYDYSIINRAGSPRDDLDESETGEPLASLTAPSPVRLLYTGDTYDISVTAKDGGNIVGTYNSPTAGITITGGMTIAIVLVPEKASGSGTFLWNLDYDGTGSGAFASLATADLEIFSNSNFAPASKVGATEDLTLAETGNRSLTAGTYYVRVTLEDASGDFKETININALRIYANMTSEFTKDYPALTSLIFPVTLNYQDALFTGGNGTITGQKWGTVITPSTALKIDGFSEKPGYVATWYMDAAGTAAKIWTVGSDLLYGPRTLYAQWAETSVTPTVTVAWDPQNNPVLSVSPATITYSSLGGVGATFKLNSYTNITAATWMIGGVAATPEATPGDGFTLAATHLASIASPITGTVIFTYDGDVHSAEFTFTFVDDR